MEKSNKIIVKVLNATILWAILLLFKSIFFTVLNINANFYINVIYISITLIISFLFYNQLRKISDSSLKKRLKNFWCGVGSVLVYFILNELESIPFLLLKIDVNTIPLIFKIMYMLCYEIMIIFIIYLLLKEQILASIKDIKVNHKNYFSKYFKYWIIAIAIMYASNLIITLISHGKIAGNEEAVRGLFNKAPIYTYISAVFLAPILEELTFRQSFRNIFANNIVFIIASGLVFGGLHVIGNVNSWVDLLYLIPYCTPGFIFAYMLSKTDNIFVSMGFHFLHNGILMSLQVLLLILGYIK